MAQTAGASVVMDAKEGKRKLPIHADGFAWVKYGEKTLSPSGLIREYYKCRNWRPASEGGSCCPARKVVDGPRRRGREQTAILGPATPREGSGKEHSGGLQHNHIPPQQKGKSKGKGSPRSHPDSPCLVDHFDSCWTPRQLSGSKRGGGEEAWLEADGTSMGVEFAAALDACAESVVPHPLQALSPDALAKLKQELLLNPPESPAGPKRSRGDGMSSPRSPSTLPPLTPSPRKEATPPTPSDMPSPLALPLPSPPAQHSFSLAAADVEVKEEAAPFPSVEHSAIAMHFSEPAGSSGCQPVPPAAHHLPPPLHLGPSVLFPRDSFLGWESRDMVAVPSSDVGSPLVMERDDGLGPLHLEHGPVLLRARGSSPSSPREQQEQQEEEQQQQQFQEDTPPLPDFWFSLGGEEEEERELAEGSKLGSQCTESEGKVSAELSTAEQQQQNEDAMASGDDEATALTRARSARRALPPLVIPDCEEEAWIAAEASSRKESLAKQQSASVPVVAASPVADSSCSRILAATPGSSPSGAGPDPSASSGKQIQELLPALLPLILGGQGPCQPQRSSGGLSHMQLLNLVNFLHGADGGFGQRQLKDLVLLLLKSNAERSGSVDMGVVIQLLSALGGGDTKHSQQSQQSRPSQHMGGAQGAMAVVVAQLLAQQSQQQDWAAPSQSGELPGASKLASAGASPATVLPSQRDFASAPSTPAVTTAGDRPSLKASEAALLASLCSASGKSTGDVGAAPEGEAGSQSAGSAETPLVSAVLPVLQQLRTQLLQRHMQQLAQERAGNNMASLAAILSTLMPQPAAAAPPPPPQAPAPHELTSLLPMILSQLHGTNDAAIRAVLQMVVAQARSNVAPVNSSPLPTLLSAVLESARRKSSEARSRQLVGSPSMHTGASAVGRGTGHDGQCSPLSPAHTSVCNEMPPNTPVVGPSRPDLKREMEEKLRARILLALANAESKDKQLPALKSPSGSAVPKDFSAPSTSVDGSSAFVGENEGPMSPSFAQRSQIQGV